MLVLFLIIPICLCSLVAWRFVRPQPKPTTETLFDGITYIREVTNDPRPMVIHIVAVDLRSQAISLMVTPGDPDKDLPLKARTTSQFLKEFDLQIAVNGSAFEPWYSHGIFDYYPHTGDPVDTIGLAAFEGGIYSQPNEDAPTLFLTPTNKARFNSPAGKKFHALSGTGMLVVNGNPENNLEPSIEPRTAVGVDRGEKTLILIVIDGRQPGYSEGATLLELSEIFLRYEAHNAMNLDGGGSSTLVMEGKFNQPVVLNSPIHGRIPGQERPVGNHLGISIKP